MSQIQQHQFDNGLTLLVEPMTGVASAAVSMMLPAGAAAQQTDKQGAASVLSEMLFRGAGNLDARAHSDALDRLGVHRNAEVQSWHMRLTVTLMGDRLGAAMPLLMDMVRRPQLPESAFDPARQLALQAVESLDDNPQEKVMVELKRFHHGDPAGRSSYGLPEHLRQLTLTDVQALHRERFVPKGTILGIAGAVDFEQVRDLVGELLGDWQGDAPMPEPQPARASAYHHEQADSNQAHIGLAYNAPGPDDPKSAMLQRLAIATLSGGMSGRLFHEVREVRGLCYAVYAAYLQMRHAGTVYAYAGTTAQRAEQTLEVLSAELKRLGDGVSQDEYERAVVGLKSRLVMQGESTGARAGAIANDQYLLGRPRTLEEIAAQIDAATLDELNQFVAAHRPSDFTTLTIGPEPLVTSNPD